MLGWSLCIGYIAILCALMFVNRGSGPMRRTVWTLFAVMIAGYAYHFIFGDAWDYSAFMIGVNAIACRIITKEPAGQWQGLVGWSLIIQMGLDTGRVGRELSSGASDMTFLYWGTTWLAFAQLLVVIGWGLHDRIVRERSHCLDHTLLSGKALHEGAA